MTDQQISREAGYKANWLSEAKHRDPHKYKVMKRMGIQNYDIYAQNLRNELANIYWTIKENKEYSQAELYYKYCPWYIGSLAAFSGYMRKMAFGLTETSPQFRAVKRMQRIVKAWRKYESDKNNSRD